MCPRCILRVGDRFIFIFQPSDSRKSPSSDSGVVSPAENAEDHQQLMQHPVVAEHPVQLEKKKEVDVERYGSARKSTGRQTSGSGANKNSGKQVCAPRGQFY